LHIASSRNVGKKNISEGFASKSLKRGKETKKRRQNRHVHDAIYSICSTKTEK